jgi:hypothetical protein
MEQEYWTLEMIKSGRFECTAGDYSVVDEINIKELEEGYDYGIVFFLNHKADTLKQDFFVDLKGDIYLAKAEPDEGVWIFEEKGIVGKVVDGHPIFFPEKEGMFKTK